MERDVPRKPPPPTKPVLKKSVPDNPTIFEQYTRSFAGLELLERFLNDTQETPNPDQGSYATQTSTFAETNSSQHQPQIQMQRSQSMCGVKQTTEFHSGDSQDCTFFQRPSCQVVENIQASKQQNDAITSNGLNEQQPFGTTNDKSKGIFVKNAEGRSVLKAGTIDQLAGYLLQENTIENDPTILQTISITHELFCGTTRFLEIIFNKLKTLPNDEMLRVHLLRFVQILSVFILRAPHAFLENTSKETQKTYSEGEKDKDIFKQRQTTGITRSSTFTSSRAEDRKEVKRAIQGKTELEERARDIVVRLAEWLRKLMPESSNKILNSLKKISLHHFQPVVAEILNKKKVKPNDILFAQQLTMYDWKLFVKLQTREFFHLSWTKPDKNETAFNVCQMIQWTNLTGNWASCYVLEGKQPQKRADRIASLITLMDNLYSMNNFNALMGIYSGLVKIPVYRLKQSWAKLPKKSAESFSRFETLFSCEKNFSNYRTKLAAATLPKIPFLGFLLSDLTFIDQGNKDTVKVQNEYGRVTELINVDKWRKVGSVLYEIIQTKAVNYSYPFDIELEETEDLEAALKCLTGGKVSTLLNDNQQMEISHQLEKE